MKTFKEFLAEASFDPNKTYRDEEVELSDFLDVIDEGDPKTVKKWLDAGADPNSARGREGDWEYGLQVAAKINDDENAMKIVEMLLKAGAEEFNGGSSAVIAWTRGNKKTARFLKEKLGKTDGVTFSAHSKKIWDSIG